MRMENGLIAVGLIAMRLLFGLCMMAGGELGAEKGPKTMNVKKLDALESSALEAMKKRAVELNIQGVGVVSFSAGAAVTAWTSKMTVVGRMTDPAASDGKGNNLLGIAYAKSAEMARTLQDSGTAKGTPMTAEFYWQGGVILKAAGGYVIVAFSGGKSEDDVQVSKAGLAVMKAGL
jgi:uncharacterized protein GlcG (DUF336 family)